MGSDVDDVPVGSMADAAYASIRRAIIGWELKPGEQISESALADRFGLGRAAVRTALTRLGHERLVRALPRRGYAIASITMKQIHDLFGARLVIEPALARLAALRADTDLISELERRNQTYAGFVSGGTMAQLRESNRDFHLAVAQAAGNDRLAEMLAGLLDEVARVLYLPQLAAANERSVSSVPEHQRIIDALFARNEHEAEQAAIEHILPNQRAVIDGLILSPQLRSVNLVDAS